MKIIFAAIAFFISIALSFGALALKSFSVRGRVGFILLLPWLAALAQTPPAIPPGRVAAQQFWLFTSSFSESGGPTTFIGVRGTTPDDAMQAYAQAFNAIPKQNYPFTVAARPCVLNLSLGGGGVLQIQLFKPIIGDDLIGPRQNSFVSRIAPYTTAFAGGGPWMCPVDTLNSQGQVVGTSDLQVQIQVVCPCNSHVANLLPRFTSDGLQYLCQKDAQTDACPEKNVGTCTAGGIFTGNPINPATGVACKVENDADYAGTANGQGLDEFRRFYSSLATSVPAGSLGRSWRHSFDQRMQWRGSNSVFAIRQDGKSYLFELVGGIWTPDADISDRLTRLTDAGGNHAGWEFVAADSENRELYDSSGRLISIATRSGLIQFLTYSDGTAMPPGGGVFEGTSIALPAGLLIRVTGPFGRELHFGYDQKLRVSRMMDPAGGTYSYTYDANNNLITVARPDGTAKQYLYNESGLVAGNLPRALTGIIDENGSRYATFTYDGDGRATSSEHAGGANKVTVSYASYPTPTVTDALGTQRTYEYQTSLAVPRSRGVNPPCTNCGAVSTAAYDETGHALLRTDWSGNRTNYSYDERNLETSRTEGLTSSGTTTPQRRRISTQWHATFRLPTRIAEPLRIITNVYDADGTACGARGTLCSRTIQATADANGTLGFSATPIGTPRVWTYTYNTNGQVLIVDGPRTDAADVTTYTYYANNDADMAKRGNVASIANALGQTTQIASYNAYGQPLTIVDANGLTTTLTYDPRQRLTSRSVGGETTTYTYDFAGQLTQVTMPDASFLSYTYDPAHRLTGIQDNLGNKITYTLDLVGNRTKEDVFDPANVLAQTKSRVYSNLNRLFQELGALNQTTEYAYDDQGNVTSVKDPLNRITANQYDPLNRLKQVTDPGTGVTLYGYNGLDALTQVTDPRNLSTTYALDGLGNLNQQVSPDTGTTANTYDIAGNLLTQTDAKGQVTTYTYDALNRVTLIAFHDGSKQAYAYDLGTNGIGRLNSITETNPSNVTMSVIAYAYDQKGRVTSETRTINGVAYVLAYDYDASGRLTGLTYPSGRTVTYTLDALGRVAQVTTTKDSQSQVVVQNVSYHPFGGAKSWTLGNGQIYSRTVDTDGRIASFTLGAASNTISFDAASRITGIAANTYGYDTLDRLSSAVLPSSNFAYSYDAVGNRLTKTTGANTDTYTYGATSNRIATVAPFGAPLKTFTLDANGSTTNDAVNTFVYDTRGRMVQSTNAASLVTSYQVNALGQRIRKTNTSGDTVFTYDTWGKLIAESDPGGTPSREYLYLGDVPVMVWQ